MEKNKQDFVDETIADMKKNHNVSEFDGAVAGLNEVMNKLHQAGIVISYPEMQGLRLLGVDNNGVFVYG